MSTRLEDCLPELVADRQRLVQKIIDTSDDPVARIIARTILERDIEIAETLNLLGRD